ncbi:MAG: hypothetical protein JST55_04505 [Bacteroidetes bacterium]|nr:hypothetical protein [Bacteroidota bacterium]
MKKNLTKIKFRSSSVLLLLFIFTLVFYGCGGSPPKDKVEELVRKVWASQGAESFLMDKTTDQPYIGTGLSDYVESKANIEEISIVEKKEAKKPEGEVKEVRMIINVKGTVGTYRYANLPSSPKARMGDKKFSVNSVYYFWEDKYGDWKMETKGEIASF